VFLELVKQLSSTPGKAIEQRQGVILALARLDDARAVPFLVDLLAQEKTPSSIDAIQQALVSKGPEALAPLQRLNQALQNDQEMLRRRGTAPYQQWVALRQRATKRAIAKIVTIYTGQLPGNRTQPHRSQSGEYWLCPIYPGAGQPHPVWDQLPLSQFDQRQFTQ
jgi:hypothetical protein